MKTLNQINVMTGRLQDVQAAVRQAKERSKGEHSEADLAGLVALEIAAQAQRAGV